MKFEQKLEANKHADWPYIDYRGLKTILKSVVKAEVRSQGAASAAASIEASPDMKATSVLAALKAPLLSGSRDASPTPLRSVDTVDSTQMGTGAGALIRLSARGRSHAHHPSFRAHPFR